MIALNELRKLPIEEERNAFQESPEFIAELERRMSAHQADPSTAIPWDIVKAKLLSRSA